MFGTVNILMALTLLFCPYVCLGQQARRGCGNRTCLDSCESDVGQEAESAGDCGCCLDKTVAQPEPLPVDHTPSTPKTPNQCLCEGALADAVNRPNELSLTSLLPTTVPALSETSLSRSHFDRFENAESAFRIQTGRGVCLILGALLL
ncbi:MAG: hypothetical protein ACE5KM_14170 [Planctomycetaceae bacterium]